MLLAHGLYSRAKLMAAMSRRTMRLMPLFHSVARESRLVLCLSVFTVSSIAGTRQEKAGHGPGTEYSACLRKSSYSSEYVNDAIAIELAEEDICLR